MCIHRLKVSAHSLGSGDNIQPGLTVVRARPVLRLGLLDGLSPELAHPQFRDVIHQTVEASHSLILTLSAKLRVCGSDHAKITPAGRQ